MRTKVLLGLAVALMLVVSVATIGSNMGFKISIPLVGGGASNWVAIPYYNSYTTVSTMWADIANVGQISYWDSVNNVFVSYTGSFLDTDFNIVAGTAYLVKITGANANWIVVGSHNPSLAVPITGGGASNWVSVPYHTTAATVSVLWGQIANVGQISYWDSVNNVYVSYTGSFLDTDFNITPGTGYLVKITGSNATWTPAHY
jgi:hypothetical protein